MDVVSGGARQRSRYQPHLFVAARGDPWPGPSTSQARVAPRVERAGTVLPDPTPKKSRDERAKTRNKRAPRFGFLLAPGSRAEWGRKGTGPLMH
ncbi:hypothetical protein VTH82DRAFT_3086 [Thermothelomyces myriococcoides]